MLTQRGRGRADSYWRPSVLSHFKIQKDVSFDKTKIWKVTKNILINQLFVTVPTGHFYAWLAVYHGVGACQSTHSVAGTARGASERCLRCCCTQASTTRRTSPQAWSGFVT